MLLQRNSGAVGMFSVIASSGNTGAAPPAVGQGEHGRAANEDLGVLEAVLARLGEHAQRHRSARHPVAAGVGEHADEDLVGVQGAQHGPAAVQQGDELAAGQLVQRRHRLEVGIGAVEEVLGQPRKGGAQPPTLHAPPAAGCRDRVETPEQRHLLADLTRETEVDGDVSLDADDDVAGGDVRRRRRRRHHGRARRRGGTHRCARVG